MATPISIALTKQTPSNDKFVSNTNGYSCTVLKSQPWWNTFRSAPLPVTL
jgi:hypothetical protein